LKNADKNILEETLQKNEENRKTRLPIGRKENNIKKEKNLKKI